MPTAYLVDGTFELFRCFHGAPRATGRSGAEVGAARALVATLVKLLTRELSVRRADLPVPATLHALEWHGARRDLVEPLVDELGDDSTVERIPRWAS